jgi:uncharacterized protein (TIGR03083 family)
MADVIDAGDVVTTRDLALDFLKPLAARDWTAPIPDLDWNCETTLRHMIKAQSMYAAHLGSRATRRIPMKGDLDPELGIDALLDNLRAQVSVLAAVIRDAQPDARSWHNSGMTDPSGYCAMSCDEVLVHTWDIGRGLGDRFELPASVCARVVPRLFPMWAPIDADPRDALLWCNGRIALPDRQRHGPDWGWWSRPIEEWNGTGSDT